MVNSNIVILMDLKGQNISAIMIEKCLQRWIL